MQGIRNLLSLIAGLLLSVIVAELVLRGLPVTMGLYRTHEHASWPLNAYGPHQNYSYSMTWQMANPHRGKTNNYGQIAPFDYSPDSHPVVTIGDSFIEAQMNDYSDTLQGELGRLLGKQQAVYGFGFSGNSLAEYLAVARLTQAEFAPVGMVFLIIDNDIKESWTNRQGHHYFAFDGDKIKEAYLPLSNGGTAQQIRKLIGDSALYRYIQVNLGFSIDGVIAKRSNNKGKEAQPQNTGEEYSRRAVDYFLTSLPAASRLPADRLVLIFDADREKIYNPAAPDRKAADSAKLQTYLKDRAKALGFSVVDTAPLFAEHYKKNHQRFDFTPTDRHWNGLAHHLAADAAARILSEKIPSTQPISKR